MSIKLRILERFINCATIKNDGNCIKIKSGRRQKISLKPLSSRVGMNPVDDSTLLRFKNKIHASRTISAKKINNTVPSCSIPNIVCFRNNNDSLWEFISQPGYAFIEWYKRAQSIISEGDMSIDLLRTFSNNLIKTSACH